MFTLSAVSRVSIFPESSKARDLTVTVPSDVGIQIKVQLDAPVAVCHVRPPSTETSTPATIPPPASVAVPVIMTVVPAATVAPSVGSVIIETGFVRSAGAVGVIRLGLLCYGSYAHVSKQVKRCLLHRETRSGNKAVMGAVKTP